jgi:excisionase family DNA binding protein
MNLSLYCSVAEAAAIAGVSRSYMNALIARGEITAHKVGRSYVVLRTSIAKFKRQPGMGRPQKAKAKRTTRRKK